MTVAAALDAVPADSPYRHLADLNAVLNATAFVLICAALIAIKQGRERRHKRLMLSAVAVSAAFLTSYLVYHYQVGSVPFQGQGGIRWVYFPILITHVVLAFVQVPLILLTVINGLRDRRSRHRKLGKVTAVIWLYVSFTGVVVYGMLYWLYPQA